MWRSTSPRTDAVSPPTSIQGPTVTLVPLARRHLERTRQWANDPELMRLLDRTRVVTAEEHERWFAGLASATDRVYMAIEETATRTHIGNVWLWSVDERNRKAELRIVIGDRAHLGHGAGSEAVDLMCRYAFRTRALHRLYAHVLAFNTRARRAFEKAGFTTEGILKDDRLADGRLVDAYLLARVDRPDHS
jgi:diamine N-acetyltransferase